MSNDFARSITKITYERYKRNLRRHGHHYGDEIFICIVQNRSFFTPNYVEGEP